MIDRPTVVAVIESFFISNSNDRWQTEQASFVIWACQGLRVKVARLALLRPDFTFLASFLDGKPEKIGSGLFHNFWPFLGYFFNEVINLYDDTKVNEILWQTNSGFQKSTEFPYRNLSVLHFN